MAYLAEANVTTAFTRKESVDGIKEVWGTFSFGNGTLQYATGGIPLGKGQLGFARKTLSCDIQSCSTNYIAKYDLTNEKIYLAYCDYNAVADGVPIEVPDTTAIAATVIRFQAKGY